MGTDLKFIGKNIRFLRRSKNLTLRQLAGSIGIQEGPLGRIERGMNLPSATVIYNLTKAFNVSADVLFSETMAPVKSASENDAFFASLEPHAEAVPQPLLSRCHEIMAAFHALEDICGVQKCAFLPLSLPFEPDYSGMDQLALRVREYLGIGSAVVFDYFELFENHGLRIILFPFQKTASDLDSISFYEPAFQNAFFFLNSRKNPEKQLFSLSNELGKILILNQMRQGKPHPFPQSTDPDPSARPINTERAAKRFAATFLMPEHAVKATVSQLGVSPDAWSFPLLLRIKHRFGVSSESFLYRLRELDLISNTLADQFKDKITSFYSRTNYNEPDASRRCLTPNGRFFDLLLTAQAQNEAQQEVEDIEKLVVQKRLIRM